MTLKERDQENVCCNKLLVVNCADTKEHCHLVCGFSNAILSNQTIKNLCIGNFETCINNQ